MIRTNSHVLSGMIFEGRLVGFENTEFGPSISDFGDVDLDKKILKNQEEKILAVRAVNILFSDVVKDSSLKKEVGEKGIVIDNPGNVVNEPGGGS